MRLGTLAFTCSLLLGCAPSSGPELVKVATARQDLKMLEPIDATRFAATVIPERLATKNVVRWSELKSLPKKVLPTDIRKGGILLHTMFANTTFRPSSRVHNHRRSVTVPVQGLVEAKPGDRIDLSATVKDPATSEWFNVALAQRVTVLDPGDGTSGPTLLLLPEEALWLVFAAQIGKVAAALRNPKDTGLRADHHTIRKGTLLFGGKVGHQGRDCDRPDPIGDAVQIIRGLGK